MEAPAAQGRAGQRSAGRGTGTAGADAACGPANITLNGKLASAGRLSCSAGLARSSWVEGGAAALTFRAGQDGLQHQPPGLLIQAFEPQAFLAFLLRLLAFQPGQAEAILQLLCEAAAGTACRPAELHRRPRAPAERQGKAHGGSVGP